MCSDITKHIDEGGQYGEYEIRGVSLPGDVLALVLVRVGKQDFLQEWAGSPEDKANLKNLERSLRKAKDIPGIKNAIKMGVLRYLKEEGLYELKVNASSTLRVACFVPKSNEHIILLFPFNGHQGKTGNVNHHIERARPYLKIAADIYEREA